MIKETAEKLTPEQYMGMATKLRSDSPNHCFKVGPSRNDPYSRGHYDNSASSISDAARNEGWEVLDVAPHPGVGVLAYGTASGSVYVVVEDLLAIDITDIIRGVIAYADKIKTAGETARSKNNE